MNDKQEMMFQLELKPQQDEEWRAWKNVCKEVQAMLNITDKEFNERKDIKVFCQKLANWGYEFALLREQTKPLDPDMKPIFYKETEVTK